MSADPIEPHERRALALQRLVGLWLAPLWVPACVALMRFALGWKLVGAREARRTYARLRTESGAPLLICANHLTMLDSFVIAWALGSPGWYLRHPRALPWNTPERRHFASTWWKRALVYVMKCVPVERGGDRRAVARTLARIGWLMERGEAALVFPEGGRSRSGRVEAGAATYGVGRLVKAAPGCRVLCVYLRGRGQEGCTDAPARGETFTVAVRAFEPKTDLGGVRGSLDLSRQVLAQLAGLEAEVLGAR